MSIADLHTQTRVTDSLWVSDIRAVREQSTARYDRVITVCQDSVAENVGCAYDHVSLAEDQFDAHRQGGDWQYETFTDAAERVVTALDSGETVLVHCHAGQNRSVAVAIAALSVTEQLDYDTAAETVVAARSVADPSQLMRHHAEQFVTDHG